MQSSNIIYQRYKSKILNIKSIKNNSINYKDLSYSCSIRNAYYLLIACVYADWHIVIDSCASF